MRDAAPKTIRLAEYRPPAYWVEDVDLVFQLHPTATRVRSRIRFRPNPDAPGEFHLHGESLKLISASIDGAPVAPEVRDDGITCSVPDGPFTWEADVEINPEANTSLEGLYLTDGIYCTQCEAEGFRRITYYPDRPDVMAPFKVRIESELPVKLSNGDATACGDGFAEWHDPWRKPSYLFALVAGDLVAHRDSFTTRSGRSVALAIWVRAPHRDKCAFAMEALKRAMLWDEQVYGREYDLDIFNIVAVDAFNAGAMENKGLNVFNAALVLASPETATDADYERIESVVAHEYFHNWTGNRITCRDWFQLCLKEGLTVFRDQQFTADVRSAPVKRISDVLALRARQFREDAGPLAHPVRPDAFVEVNNFYTATVYEKGAEVVGMLRTLVGAKAYKRAVDLYFQRHDGQACTVEDWLAVFEDVTGRDLGRFARWYSQAGTPHVRVREHFDAGTFTLTLAQHTPPTPGQPEKAPLVIPVAVGLLDQRGTEVVSTRVLELREPEQSFTFEGLAEPPVLSLLRGFSAPVVLDRHGTAAEHAFLLAHDTDPFNRWEAGRALARASLLAQITAATPPEQAFLDALGPLLGDGAQDPAFLALCLRLPSIEEIAQALAESGTVADPVAIHAAVETLSHAIAEAHETRLAELYQAHQLDGPYRPDAADAGRRALAHAALGLLTRLDGGDRAAKQFAAATDMTRNLAALAALVRAGRAETQLREFEERWRDDRLVMDKWFGLQTSLAPPAQAVAITDALTRHPAFDWKTPNRFRSVLGGLAANVAGFHDATGGGYALMADWLIRLDPVNPQTAARMTAVFETWRRYDEGRQAQIGRELARIRDTPGLSRDTSEMVARILGA